MSRGRRLLVWVVAAALAGLAAVSVAVADFAPANWPYFKPVTVPAGIAAGDLVELALDREVYQDSQAGQGDLRLIRDGTEEVAYQLAVLSGRQEWQSVSAEVRDINYLPGQYSAFVVDVGPGGALHNEVEILLDGSDPAGRNFRRQTRVEAGDDGESWAVVREAAEIYDFTAAELEFNAGNTRVKYPQTAARYLRVRVVNGAEPPLKITGARVGLAVEQPPVTTPYRATVAGRVEAGETGDMIWTLELDGDGIPASRLSFQTPAANFHRSVAIEGSSDGQEWEGLADGEVYSFDTPRFVGSRLSLDFPESRYRYYRLTVANRDDPPLPMSDITLHGVERRLRFQAQPGGQYALYYGNPQARRPAYDLERVVAYLDTDDLPGATLGRQQDNPAFTGLDAPLTERYPWLLPAAVMAAAAAIGGLLFVAFRKAGRLLAPPEEE